MKALLKYSTHARVSGELLVFHWRSKFHDFTILDIISYAHSLLSVDSGNKQTRMKNIIIIYCLRCYVEHVPVATQACIFLHCSSHYSTSNHSVGNYTSVTFSLIHRALYFILLNFTCYIVFILYVLYIV